VAKTDSYYSASLTRPLKIPAIEGFRTSRGRFRLSPGLAEARPKHQTSVESCSRGKSRREPADSMKCPIRGVSPSDNALSRPKPALKRRQTVSRENCRIPHRNQARCCSMWGRADRGEVL